MKKLLVLLFSTLISFNSYGGLFDKTVCIETETVERGGLIYLPNKTKPFSGKNLCKYENGQNQSKGNIKNGKRDGEWKGWYENGQLFFIANLTDGKGDGKVTRWYENGQKKDEGRKINDRIEGKYTRWNKFGVLVEQSNWKDGKCVSGDCP